MPGRGGRKKGADAERIDPRAALNDYDQDELNKALEDTFPASDPVALASPTTPGRPNHGKPAGQHRPPRAGRPPRKN